MGVDRFEDLICWKHARELERRVFAFTGRLPASRDFDFCRQIKKSSSSAPRNISEGFGRFWPGEFAHKLHIAVGELRETVDHLEKALEEKYIDDAHHLEMFGLADAAIRAAVKFIVYPEAAGSDWKKDFVRRRRDAYRAERRKRTCDPDGKIGAQNASAKSNENQNQNQNQNQNENPER